MVIKWPEKISSEEDIKKQKLAKFFAEQEQKDMKEFLEALLEQIDMNYMYADFAKDFTEFFKGIEAKLQKKYYADKNTLTKETEEKIVEYYNMRFDVNEFYENYLKD